MRGGHERIHAHFGLAVDVGELRSPERAILRTVVTHKRLVTSYKHARNCQYRRINETIILLLYNIVRPRRAYSFHNIKPRTVLTGRRQRSLSTGAYRQQQQQQQRRQGHHKSATGMPIVFGHVMSLKKIQPNPVTTVCKIIIIIIKTDLADIKLLTIAERQYGFNRNLKSSSGKLHLTS